MKKSRLRKLIEALKVKPMTKEEHTKARLNAYKPVK
jgi:hypothetical protein